MDGASGGISMVDAHFESAARESSAMQNAMQHAAVLARMALHQQIGGLAASVTSFARAKRYEK